VVDPDEDRRIGVRRGGAGLLDHVLRGLATAGGLSEFRVRRGAGRGIAVDGHRDVIGGLERLVRDMRNDHATLVGGPIDRHVDAALGALRHVDRGVLSVGHGVGNALLALRHDVDAGGRGLVDDHPLFGLVAVGATLGVAADHEAAVLRDRGGEVPVIGHRDVPLADDQRGRRRAVLGLVDDALVADLLGVVVADVQRDVL